LIGITIAALLSLSGCTSHVLTPLQQADDVAGRTQLDTAPDSAFGYSKTQVPFTNHVVGRGANSRYELRRLEIPSIGENAQQDNLIEARYFRSTEPGPRPLVIVLPIWARYTYPSKKICRHVQHHSKGGVHLLDVEGVRFLIDWDDITGATDEESFLDLWRVAVERERVTMIDIRRLVDWAEQRPEIDATRIAIVGFSHSAIIAGTVVTQEPRLAAAVLVMGGAEPHHIIARCQGKRTSSVQKTARKRFGWDQDELAKRLGHLFHTVDAASYPGRVDPRKVLIVDAGRDRCIPETSRDALWEAMGRPERISLDYGHRMSFLSMTPFGGSWMCHRIWDFLEQKLLAE
jgi:dienelactone hydrolase